MTTPKIAAEPAGDRLRLRPVAQCAADIGKCVKTLDRMADRDPVFPPFITFGNQRHLEDAQWEAYKRLLLERGTQARPRKAASP